MSASPKGSAWQSRFQKWLVGEPNEINEQRGYCPIHEDPDSSSTPSASFNWTKGQFFCFGGCQGMSFQMLWLSVQEDEGVGGEGAKVRDIGTAKSAKEKADPLPTDEQLAKWHKALLDSASLLEKLKTQRGFTMETIERFNLGWDSRSGRFTIPVLDLEGHLVNVRKYKMNAAKAADKMTSIMGHGERRIFFPDVLDQHDTVVMTEGEMDAILARQYGFPAFSHTAGAAAWQRHWAPLFKDKTVFIVYDVDDAGRGGATVVAGSLKKFAKAVYTVVLPSTVKGFDVTNFFVDQGGTAEDFQRLLDDTAEKAEVATGPGLTGKPVKVTLEDSMSSNHYERPISFTSSIAGKIQPPYMLPKKVEFRCSQDAGPKCNSCPLYGLGGYDEMEIESTDRVLLALKDKSPEGRSRELLKMAGIPPTCNKVEAEDKEQWTMEELVVLPSVDDRDESTQNPISRRVMNVGPHATPINTVATFVGTNRPDAKDGRAILQTWMCEETKTNLDRFEMSKDIYEELLVFQPKKDQSPLDKMRAIARDLEANVTNIYGRPELHIAYDLVWHSVMDFNLFGKPLGKGWLELLVMGDTRTGKSEAALRLCDHYQAGILKSCEGATLAGLVGGAQQVGTSWMVSWGTIPLQDRRLVVLDEVSGISDKNIIEQMSAVRSSGRAQIVKIVSQETSARTRLIWISNPPDGRAINEMNLGAIEAIQKLVKNPEDVARFDLAMSAASQDVESTVINSNQDDRAKVRHRFNRYRCSNLVAWAWSRKRDDIVFTKGTEDYLLGIAEALGKQYISEPPLIQAENVRVKLARIAVAVAARMFSTDAAGQQVIVTPAHVDAAVEVIDMLYGMESFGYKANSRKELRSRKQAEDNRKACVKYLTARSDDVFVALQSVIHDTDFRIRDFEEFAGMDKDSAQTAVKELIAMRMLRRKSRGYLKMQPELIHIVRTLDEKWEGS